MTQGEVVLLALFLALGAGYVALPSRRSGPRIAPRAPEPDPATADKRVALTAIVEVEEEHAAGKLTERDFVDLRARYERDAVVALRAERAETDDPLEAEIAAVRERLACPSCGTARAPGDACPRCGA